MTSKTKIDRVAEVMRNAMKLNEKTERAVFVRFSGHVNKMEVQVCRAKLGGYSVQDYHAEIDLDDPKSTDFNRVIKKLQSFM